MIWLPFTTFGYFFSRPRLFVLGVFPGVFTFAASCGLVYALWTWLLQEQSLWIALPLMMVALLVLWLVVGKLALLPVEDAIIDECQRALWNEVRLPSPPMTLRRLGREMLFSMGLLLAAVVLVGLSFVPFLAPLQFLGAAWLGAYSFLSAIYSRKVNSPSGRITLFFGHPLSHFFLGAFLNILLFIPVVNVFLLGYAQVLATLLYFHREPPASLKT